MKFQELPIKGAYLIEIEPIEDERGFFARTFCHLEFKKRGLHGRFEQTSISYNKKKGTLRGMHYQVAPHEEVKLVTCRRGKIFDAIVDLRPDSPTYKQWVGVVLDAAEYKTLYIPKGVAHGFQTLEDDVELFYQITKVHVPEASRGARWDAFGIEWPLEVTVMSKKDQAYE